MLKARMAVRYGTFGICVLHTSHLEPYRTSVPYFSSIFEAYRTRTIQKKAYRTSEQKLKRNVLYQRTVPYCHSCFQLLATLTDFEITSL